MELAVCENRAKSGAGRTAAMAVSHLISPALVTAAALPMRIKLVAFDGFAIFDTRPVFGLAE
jgi:hypothetical protein